MGDSCQLYIGINLPARQGISNQHVVDSALAQGYDLITSRITSRTYRKRVQGQYASSDPDPDIAPPMGEDLVVFPGTHVSNTIALCAPWAELDSKDVRIADLSYKVLEQEMAYAKFCGLPYVVIEGPKRRTHLARYAHSLAKLLRKFKDMKIMVHTTFTEDFRDGCPPPDLLSTWYVWDGIRTLCDYPPNLGLTLEVQHTRVPDFVLARWMCEPVMMLVLSESRAFVPNPKNYPVLPRHTQNLVRRFATLQPFFLIKENLGPNKLIEFNGGDDACLIYLRNMLAKADPRQSTISQQSRASRHVDAELPMASNTFSGNRPDSSCSSADSISDSFESCHCEAYADVLETPLQPLSDPLDSQVYDVFETDSTKYDQYFRAVSRALQSLISIPSQVTSVEDLSISGSTARGMAKSASLVIAVLGAGRGALVDRILDAVVATRAASVRPITIYAVEKYSGPVAYLLARKSTEPAWEHVEVVHADMRTWTPKTPVNLMVSELLGSFGDNELSPECLHRLEWDPNVLAPQGIMIPSSYTSYIAPVFCPQLWAKARSQSEKGLETPYVVCLHQAERLAPAQPAWTFDHPALKQNTFRRYAKLSFATNQRSAVYGFAGYFEAELYGGFKLSTVPPNSTPGLTSWFPMLFPLKHPIDVLPDSTVEISIWREGSKSRVWYEWAVETLVRKSRTGVSNVHNSEGHALSMRLD